MRTTLLILLFALTSTQLLKSQIKIHHGNIGLSPINAINNNELYATLGGLGHTIFAKVTLDPLNHEYLNIMPFDIQMSTYALIGDKGWSIDYQGAVYTTNDGFQTTEKLVERNYKKFVKTNSGIVAHGTDNKIYFTEDAVNWTYKANSLYLYVKGDMVWGTNDDNKLVISDDGGKTWETSVDLSQYNNLKTIDVVNKSTIIILADSKLNITTNGGETWKTTNLSQSYNPQVLSFINADFGFNTDNNVTTATNNGGDTWVTLDKIFPTVPETGNISIWAVMQETICIALNGTFYYTKDQGQTWAAFHKPSNAKFDIHQKGKVIITGSTYGNYSISNDGGKIFNTYKWGKEDIMAVAVIDENKYVIGDRKGQVSLITEGGEKIQQKTTSAGNYNALHFESSADGSVILSTRIGQPAISTDGGQTFKFPVSFGGTNFQTLKPNGDVINVNQGGIINKVNPSNGQKTELFRMTETVVTKRISMATNDVGYLFCFKSSNTLSTYITKDGWASVQLAGDIENITPTSYISISHIADGHVIITADGGTAMYETKNYGSTWTSKQFDLLRTFGNRVSPIVGSSFTNTNNFWLVTETGYIFWNEGETSTTTSSNIHIKNKEQNIQVYPNPVSESLYLKSNNIDISTIEIFNLNGKLVFKQNTSNLNPIDVSNWTNGIYIIEANATNGQTYHSKFVKQ